MSRVVALLGVSPCNTWFTPANIGRSLRSLQACYEEVAFITTGPLIAHTLRAAGCKTPVKTAIRNHKKVCRNCVKAAEPGPAVPLLTLEPFMQTPEYAAARKQVEDLWSRGKATAQDRAQGRTQDRVRSEVLSAGDGDAVARLFCKDVQEAVDPVLRQALKSRGRAPGLGPLPAVVIEEGAQYLLAELAVVRLLPLLFSVMMPASPQALTEAKKEQAIVDEGQVELHLVYNRPMHLINAYIQGARYGLPPVANIKTHQYPLSV
jgi:hypothetical protein